MCGFAGEIAREGAADVAAVARMAEELAPRGPDGEGAWSDGRIALAHRRLAIIDLSDRGAQPMVDERLGLVGVFNGIVYNHRELRRELEAVGHTFFSASDTEVMLKAWAHWGDRFVERLHGMFAFAFVETRSGRMLLGRDRLGKKPLYLAEAGGALRFASTLPAIVKGGGVDTSVDPIALHHYLTWHAVVPAPWTILAGVRKLDPATVMAVEPDGQRASTRYWEPSFTRHPDRDDWIGEDWERELLDALRRAVRRRMVSDVPVGVLLSGGLDSSLIVSLLAEQGQTGLTTFSIGFQDRGGIVGDEFAFSDVVAAEYGTDHRKIPVPDERLLPALPGAVRAMSEPMVSHDAVAFYLLSQEVAKEVKVVQSGQGADEVLAGYSWYPEVDDAAEGLGAGSYRDAFFDRPHDEIESIVAPDLRVGDDVSMAFVASHFARPGAETPVDRALRLDTTVMLVDDPVKRLDNMSMAWGLESRTPFLDHEVVELAASCPPELKLAEDGKGVLKRAARTVLPAEVVDRPKGYFPVPALRHLEGGFLDLVRDVLTSQRARDRGVFAREHVDALLAAPNEHRTTLGASKLWQVGLLELWFQQQGL